MRTPADDPDKRPLLDRIQDPAQLARDLGEWVRPTFDLIADEDLRARCLQLLSYASATIYRLAGELAHVREMGDALVDALPTCDDCGAPATKAVFRGGGRWCDGCGPLYADYPRAAPLRAWQEARAKR